MIVATLRILPERHNTEAGRSEKVWLWMLTDRTVHTWLNEAVGTAASDEVAIAVLVTRHTFRHWYAMHML